MPIPSEEPVTYQHPRWLVRCATIGFVLLYVCSLSAANIFPHGNNVNLNQQHGWPFVYMVREWQIPGGMSVFYGPWPFDDSPIVLFRPILLGLNCLIGILLTVFAATIPAYWLRVRQRPVQFSLQTLFLVTTLVACLLALLKVFCPEQFEHFNVWTAIELAIVLSFLLAYYVVPACMVLSVAHWLVVRSGRLGGECGGFDYIGSLGLRAGRLAVPSFTIRLLRGDTLNTVTRGNTTIPAFFHLRGIIIGQLWSAIWRYGQRFWRPRPSWLSIGYVKSNGRLSCKRERSSSCCLLWPS